MSGQEVQVQDLLRTLSSLTRRVYYGINRAATDCKVCQNCEAQGKGRAKGRLRKSIVDCQLSIVDYRYRFP